MSRSDAGITWMVSSRATSDCQSLAADCTRITAPIVSEARNVMIATTAVSARPATVAFGTIGVSKLGNSPAGYMPDASAPASTSRAGSIVDMQPPFVQHDAAGLVLVHQCNIVGCDDYRGAGLVELDEQSQQALREIGIDVAGRLIGEQKMRPRDHRARDCSALLLPARKHRRQRPH